MTQDEFNAAYPYATRRECLNAISAGRINGWAESGRFGKDERYRIHVIVSKPVPKKKVGEKRVTAASICKAVYLKLLKEADGDNESVERNEYMDLCLARGVGRSTAYTRFADYATMELPDSE